MFRAARDAVVSLAGSVGIGVVIVVVGLGWTDEVGSPGALTEAAYLAVAVAALAVCGFGAGVAVSSVRAATATHHAGDGADGADGADASDRPVPPAVSASSSTRRSDAAR